LTLATVEAQAGHFDEAIQIAERVHAAEPNNVQADRVLSSSLIQKGDFVAALDPLQRGAAADHSVATQYSVANCLLQTKRPDDRARAKAVFETIAAEHGGTGSLHVLMGRSYRDAGDLASAIAEFKRALAIDPGTPHANYFLGLAQLSENEWRSTPEAEASIRKEVELYPQDYLANFMTGFLLSEDRRYDEAQPYLKAAATLDSTSPDPWLYLGLNAYAKDNKTEAETDLRKAVVLTGSDEARPNYQIRRAYVDLGRILDSSGRKDEGETFLTKARDLQNKTMEQTQQTIAAMASPDSSSAAVVATASNTRAADDGSIETAALDTSLLNRDDRLSQAQRAAFKQRDEQLRDVLALAYNDLGTVQARQRNCAAAASLYVKAEDWNRALPGLEKNLGQSEFCAGNFEASISPLTQALIDDPSSHGLRAMLGIAFYSLNRFAEAARTFEPLGDAGMKDDEVGYAWAASLAHISDNLLAASVLKVFAAEPRAPDVELLIGQLWTSIGDYARAVATLQEALAAEANLPHAHFLEGLAYIHWEHWPEAASAFQAELALNPDDPDALYHLGFVYLQQNRSGDAVKLFEQVVTTHPGYANAQYQLGKLDLDQGNTVEAITHLEAAEHSSPSAAYIHYQLQAAYRKANRPEDAERELQLYKQLKADARAQSAERASIH
jgi:tetratricopeptide (TPR) repeat protein